MKMIYNQPYHLVSMSPWPLITSLSTMNMLIGVIVFFNYKVKFMMIMGLMLTMLSALQWWRDTIRESYNQGMHMSKVVKGLKLGMILFIVSEILFFFSLFWSYMHSSLSPSVDIGNMWPPQDVSPFNPYSIPLINTILLLSSGAFITWSHFSLISKFKYKEQSIISLQITIILGVIFLFIQSMEYKEAPFTFSDSTFGSNFFMITGFHGFHVFIGIIFLFVCLFRLYKNQMSSYHHFNFEAAAWYWHFVDVVWIVVYTLVYWLNY